MICLRTARPVFLSLTKIFYYSLDRCGDTQPPRRGVKVHFKGFFFFFFLFILSFWQEDALVPWSSSTHCYSSTNRTALLLALQRYRFLPLWCFLRAWGGLHPKMSTSADKLSNLKLSQQLSESTYFDFVLHSVSVCACLFGYCHSRSSPSSISELFLLPRC